jgi:hypothetical protein
MYRPPGDGLAEFIELLNISDSVTLDLTNVRFTQGVEFNFTNSAIQSLAPGARVLIVRDLAAFTPYMEQATQWRRFTKAPR